MPVNARLFSEDSTPTSPVVRKAPVPTKKAPARAVVKPTAKAVKPPGKGQTIGLKAHMEYVEIERLHPDPDNPRTVFKKIDELAEGLKADGMLQPIVARVDAAGKLVIMWGHRRHAAAQRAGWTHVPVIVREDVADSSILSKQLQENSHRQDLDPIDTARGIRRYMHDKKIATYEEAGRRLGHSGSWAGMYVALLDLPEEEQAAVSRGELGVMAAATRAHRLTGRSRASKNGTPQQRTAKRSRSGPVTTRSFESPTAWFGSAHPQASRARALKVQHQCAPLPGGIACGECWEMAIREDASKR